MTLPLQQAPLPGLAAEAFCFQIGIVFLPSNWCVNKGFLDYFAKADADIFCIQETKLQEGQFTLECEEEYEQYWNYAVKKGYSGTAVFTKLKPLSVRYGLEENHEPEGRVITLEFAAFFLVNVYTPNAKRDLSRLDERMEWEDRFRRYLLQLDAQKPVIVCGDLNVAHQEIDIKNARSNRNNSGFTKEEREKMTRLLESGFIDTFRHFYPDQPGAYTWWSYMPNVQSATSAGASIIFSSPKGSPPLCWTPKSTQR